MESTNTTASDGSAIAGIIVLVIFLLIYFIPFIVNYFKKTNKNLLIFCLNLLLGWTVIGWILILIWSIKFKNKEIIDSTNDSENNNGFMDSIKDAWKQGNKQDNTLEENNNNLSKNIQQNNQIEAETKQLSFDELKIKALEFYTSIQKLDPEYRKKVIISRRESKKRLLESLKLYDTKIKLDPDNSLHYRYRGLIYNNLDMYDEAISDFDKAIELDVNEYINYLLKINIYHELQLYDVMLPELNKTIELFPTFPELYFHRYDIYIETGNAHQAEEDLNKYIKLDPNLKYVEDAYKLILTYVENEVSVTQFLAFIGVPGFEDELNITPQNESNLSNQNNLVYSNCVGCEESNEHTLDDNGEQIATCKKCTRKYYVKTYTVIRKSGQRNRKSRIKDYSIQVKDSNGYVDSLDFSAGGEEYEFWSGNFIVCSYFYDEATNTYKKLKYIGNTNIGLYYDTGVPEGFFSALFNIISSVYRFLVENSDGRRKL